MSEGVNPDIALGGRNITPPDPFQRQSNMLGLMQGQVQLQNFQNAFAARQRAGQIIANAPDYASGVQAAMKDPLVAAYGMDAIKSAGEVQQQLLNVQGTGAAQGRDAVASLYHSLGATLPQPGQPLDMNTVQSTIKSQLQAYPPDMRARLAPAMQQAVNSIYANLPEDPQQARDTVVKRLTGQALGAGFSTDTLGGMLGRDTYVPMGNQTDVVRTAVGGTPQVIGSLQQGTAPHVVTTPAGGQQFIPGYTPQGQPMSGGMPGSPGGPMTPLQAQNESQAQQQFMGPEKEQYNSQGQALGTVQSMMNEMQSLAKVNPGDEHNWLAPGVAQPQRAQIANVLNTVNSMFNPGSPPIIDPTKVGTSEYLYKQMTQLGSQMTNAYFGQHNAASTIFSQIKATPGTENTLIGSLMIGKSLEATLGWQRGLHEYKQELLQQGKPIWNADEQYAQINPPEKVLQQAVEGFGITPGIGFNSKEDVGKALANHWITRAEAKQAIIGQGLMEKSAGGNNGQSK